ncbi:hypothetical protein M1146_07080 [Patescibacteria group bacterium]|nr:hypothetical protein [Patescibacteria group bacterium]
MIEKGNELSHFQSYNQDDSTSTDEGELIEDDEAEEKVRGREREREGERFEENKTDDSRSQSKDSPYQEGLRISSNRRRRSTGDDSSTRSYSQGFADNTKSENKRSTSRISHDTDNSDSSSSNRQQTKETEKSEKKILQSLKDHNLKRSQGKFPKHRRLSNDREYCSTNSTLNIINKNNTNINTINSTKTVNSGTLPLFDDLDSTEYDEHKEYNTDLSRGTQKNTRGNSSYSSVPNSDQRDQKYQEPPKRIILELEMRYWTSKEYNRYIRSEQVDTEEPERHVQFIQACLLNDSFSNDIISRPSTFKPIGFAAIEEEELSGRLL